MDNLLTTSQMAEQSGMRLSQVLYILMARRIDPVMRIAQIRLYSPDVMEKLKTARREIRKRRRAIPHV